MAGLKVVALISGGKDSLFSILHCIANGHEVIALANLHPPLPLDRVAVEDLDSYIYQTVGHTVIPSYEEALGLPLYRQEIVGSAVNQQKSYSPASQRDKLGHDETESLVPLLQKVMVAHPEVNAVSTGAILSDYQRTRVESVAVRLGLMPLSYLWQYPHLAPNTQTSLLQDMGDAGQDSRIIKVASGGLDEGFLWQNVADSKTIARLNKASQRFGSPGDGAVLGEGGEYETLAIDGPATLWKGSIAVDGDERQIVSGDAGSSSVRILKARVISKASEQAEPYSLRLPHLLEPRFEKLLDFGAADGSKSSAVTNGPVTAPLPKKQSTINNTLLLSNVTAPGADAASQMRSIMEHLAETLQHQQYEPTQTAYTSIILRNMTDFASVNAVYGSFFTKPNPPARITLACADVIPADSLVSLTVTSCRLTEASTRTGLHVQSRSYWAPANIGPYSQAVSVPADYDASDHGSVVYIAGQIPLMPASMELHTSTGFGEQRVFLEQAALALQHLCRVGEAMSVRLWMQCIAFVTADSAEQAQSRAALARHVWSGLHEQTRSEKDDESENEGFDVWHAAHGPGHPYGHTQQSSAKRRISALREPTVIQVDALPKGASIEWAAYGQSGDLDPETFIPHHHHLLQMFSRRVVA